MWEAKMEEAKKDQETVVQVELWPQITQNWLGVFI